MKRKFVLLTFLMCILGGFNLSNINAQTTVTIDGADNATYSIADNWQGYGASQQIYTATEIGSAGTITKIAFHKADNTNDGNRTWSIYLKEIDATSFTNNSTYPMTSNDLVYSGTFNASSGWVTLDINDFAYNGGNLLVTVLDNSGSKSPGDQNWSYNTSIYSKCLVKSQDASIDITSSNQFNVFGGRFSIQLTFEGGAAQPLSLTASAEKGTIYNGETVQLIATASGGAGSNYTYSWSPATGLDNATIANPTFTPTAAGTYTFTCTVSDGTETLTTDVTITVNEAPKEIVIGQTSGDYSVLPGYNYYNYSISQQIYTSDDLSDLGNGFKINSISFMPAIVNQSARNWSVYLINTTKEQFDSSTSFIALSESDCLYTGDITFEKDKWTIINFTTPFIYEGNNILVCVKDNKGNYNYGSNNQYYSIASNGKLLSVLNYNDYNSYNVSNVSNYTNYETTGVRSAIKLEYEEVALQLSLTVSADKEYIQTDGSVQLTAKAKGGTGNYTYSWSSVDGLTANNNTATFTPTASGTYTFTCTVSDGETTAKDDVTVTVYEKPNLAKQYRIKVSTDSHVHYGKYLNIISNTQPADSDDNNTYVNVSTSAESNNQIFTLEDAGNGRYYLRSADGYYIKCGTNNFGKAWNVYAYSTTDKTPILFDYVDGSNFYLRDDDKAGDNYFKVENGKIYCNAPSSNTDVVTWTLEEAIVAEPEKPTAPTNLTANALSYNTIDLSWNAVNGATSYNVYLKGSVSKIGSVNGTSFQVTELDGEKEYCFTVTAVNIAGESDPSEEECTTTPAEPVGCKIIFELRAAGDYGWGANGALAVFYTGGPEDGDILDLTSGTSKTYSYIWTEGTELSVRLLTGSYPEEMGFTIKYENGVVIRNYNIGEISSSLNNNMFLYRHIVDCSLPVPNVIARAIGKSGVELTWDDINIANGYNVYDEDDNLIAENLTESSYVIKGLNATSEYCFTVTAVYEDDEESEHSELACATTLDSDVQEGVIGDGGESKEWIPIATYHKYSYSQQSYTKNEIANAGGAEGYISSVSYYVTSLGTTTNPRNLRVFLSNVDSQNEITFDRNTYQLISEDLVYEGPVTLTAGWVKINFQKPFKYNGNHIVITVIDDTGDTDYGDTYFSLHEKDENYKYWVVRGNSESKIDLTTSISGTNYAYRNDIKLSFVSEDVDIKFIGTGAWNDIDNWNVKFVPTADKDVIISGDAVITDDVTINSITIDGGSLTVEANNSLTINGNMINDDASAFVIEDSAQVFQTNDNVLATFLMNVENPTGELVKDNITGWQFISSPMKDAATAGFETEDGYDLFKYVGDIDTEDDLEWINYKGHKDTDFETKFKQGRGYMASYHIENGIAEFVGELNNATNFSFDDELTYHGDDHFANFYLLGNPFAFDMKWNNNNIAASGLAEGYAVVTTDGSYNYATTGDIKVGDGFFVKVTGTNPSLSYTANTRNRNVDENKYINLIASNKAGNDNVIINFADNGRDGFAKLENFNKNIAEIYVKDNEKRYGILNYDEDIEEIDVYFNAKKIGYYTINAISNADFSNVTLIDRITGIETNILTDSYTFQATTNDSPERFIIRIDKETESENFVYKSGEELIINAKGCVQIIDVMGRIVYSNDIVNDNHRINISSFKNATYIVRVVNTNEVKTQKIVIW